MPKHVHAKRGSGNGKLSADDANAIEVSAEATKILACRKTAISATHPSGF